MKIAIVYLEKGSIHTVYVPFKDEEEVREIVLNSMENITGLPREKLLRIERVEIKEINFRLDEK